MMSYPTPPPRSHPRIARALAVVVLALVAAIPARAAEPSAPTAARGAGDGKPAHTHRWEKQSQKEWVPPVKEKVQVGVDAKGKPIFETKVVKPGYWRTVTFFRCSCGQTKR